MANLNLPQSITIGRLLDALSLQALGDTLVAQSISMLSIQTIHFTGINTFSLPFVGETITLDTTENRTVALSVEVYNEKYSLLFAQRSAASWPEVCENGINWLERELGKILMTSEHYSQMIADHLTNGNGFSFLASLRDFFGCDIFLTNKQLEVLSWAGGKTLPLAPISFKAPEMSRSSSAQAKLPAALSIGQWTDKAYHNVPLTWCFLSGPKGVLGYLGLVKKIKDIGSIEQFFLHRMATLILLELVKTQSIQDTERQHHRDFLFDLLYNNFDSLEVIISRGKLWGWNFSKPHFVVVGEIAGYDPDSSDRKRFEELVTEMTSLLHRLQPKTICLERNGQVVLLFPLESMLPQSEWHSQALKYLDPILKMLKSLPGKQPFQYGLGNLYNSARYLHRSFQEARTALELGKLFDNADRLISFHGLGIMRLLHRLDRQELEDFRLEVLGPLLKFDKESNLDLEKTLLAYFSCNTDLNAAGDKLYLHPNTLRYRLKKASEILDRDLSSLENQVNLFLALKIGCLKNLWPD